VRAQRNITKTVTPIRQTDPTAAEPSDLRASALYNVRLWTFKGVLAALVYALLDVSKAIREEAA
jgi:hypothetical protein